MVVEKEVDQDQGPRGGKIQSGVKGNKKLGYVRDDMA